MSVSKTLVIRVDPEDPDEDIISYAATAVRSGGIVAFPTETVYGLAVNLSDKRAVERLYGIKKRIRGKPLTVHIADKESINKMGCRITKRADRLIGRFWPGPLTIILASRRGGKVGFRMPANRVALELIKAAGVPVGAPSANLSGRAPATRASQVLKYLDGRIDMLLDAGPSAVGKESTVVDISSDPPVILREAAVAAGKILKEVRRR
ncbi:MAG: threonylcarbamoyl-AMP synthase [Candidatus Omnitrophica bacterium]|nr:threonylcarbamoyl-AMP synthase [Candidatus Omnitrophota bacterium]